MPRAYIALGSNRGDRHAALDQACRAIAALPGVHLRRCSSIYETDPMGPGDQPRYLNAVVEIDTTLRPHDLWHNLADLETALGREPARQRRRWGPRVIDLDILLYDDLQLRQPDLAIPHPGMADRWFVLKPLADLAPTLRHPILHRTVQQMLADLETSNNRPAQHP